MSTLWGGGSRPYIISLVLSCLIATPASSSLIHNRIIVEYVVRPDTVFINAGQVYSGNQECDSLLNAQVETIDEFNYLWVDETPERTYLSRCVLYYYTDSLTSGSLEDLAAELKTRGQEVDSAYLDHLMILDQGDLPNDPYFVLEELWHLSNTASSGSDIDWVRLWRKEKDSTFPGSPIVAVPDGGSLFKTQFTAPPLILDLLHSDVSWSNTWANPGEDLNSNGEFDENPDYNGVDDDGNGYVDDVVGWDFVQSDDTTPHLPLGCDLWPGSTYFHWPGDQGDPFPNGAHRYHGSKVAGIIAGQVNNGLAPPELWVFPIRSD